MKAKIIGIGIGLLVLVVLVAYGYYSIMPHSETITLTTANVRTDSEMLSPHACIGGPAYC